MKINMGVIKTIIAFAAVLNIIAMMVFDYDIPSFAASPGSDTTQDSIDNSDDKEREVGLIEAVEQEEANKETKAAENALAKSEVIDKEEEEEEEVRDPEAPILELTDDHIYLSVGERFNYMSYIKTMEDVDGSDLSHYIYLDRDVDTSVPGDIELTYRITSTITGKSDSKVLLITVVE